ncbi:hypothetical protein [Providencia sneebia]|uniref:Uncharacterized protein n=1 Tax=Providencia sneebia DSM 19967 TaxID=1141660 RepID=K8WEM5_9GAMM|nr:hypothetical protein [Providencia sneebia]EKT58361.1 hypothetical protein OO7_06554 [Providencia sneebia DSM 19967]
MAMTLEQRKQQLRAKKTTQGIGENEVIGGNANNYGYNNGVVEGGMAVDQGLGNGVINGGNAINNNINESIINAGSVINSGLNNSYVVGGNAKNDGVNKNNLLAGSASNDFGSINKEESFIQGGDAFRNIQQYVDTYSNTQNQLNQMQEDYVKIKAQLETGIVGDHTLSQSEKQELELLLKEKNDKIVSLTNQSSKKDSLIRDITAQLEAANKQTEELKESLYEANGKKNYLSEKVADAQKEIHELNENIEKYKDIINNHENDKYELSKKVSDLEIELDKKKGELEKNHQLIEQNKETISKINAEIDAIKNEYAKTEDKLKKQLDETMEKVSTLEKEGKEKQLECAPTIKENPKKGSVTETIKANEKPSSSIVNGGCVQNTGTNAGLIHAGNSQSITMNNELNINNNYFSNVNMTNKLSESMNSFGCSKESVSCQVLGRVECNAQPVIPVVASNLYSLVC